MDELESIHPCSGTDPTAEALLKQVLKEDPRTWLATSLSHGRAFYDRLTDSCRELLALSRQRRRSLLRKLGTSLVGAALVLALSGGGGIHAAGITVNASCSLVNAIKAANTDTAVGGCAAGSGADVITLATDVTLASYYGYYGDYTATPIITSNVTIEGAGHSVHTSVGLAGFAALVVGNSGNLTLNHTTITGDSTAVRNVTGALTVNNCTITDNDSIGIQSWQPATVNNSIISDNEQGIAGTGVTVNNSTVSGNTDGIRANDLTLNNSTVTGNYQGVTSSGTSTITNSTISDNTYYGLVGLTPYTGPASSTIVRNSTISGNGVRGIATRNESHIGNLIPLVTLERSVVSGNHQDEINTTMGGTVTANSSNVLGDNSKNNAAAFIGFTPGASDIVATSDGTQPTALADILNPLASNGGLTQTQSLPPTSPAIDITTTNCPAQDQRGQPRNDLACDAGAFELKFTDGHTVTRTPSNTALTTFGPALTGMQNTGGTSPGVTTVTKTAPWPIGTPAAAIGAFWDISPTNSSGLDLTLELCYRDAESNGQTLANLSFWRYSSNAWSLVGAPSSTVHDVNGNNCATLNHVTQLARFTLAASNPGVILLEQEDLAVQYDSWRGVRDPSANGGGYRVSSTKNATATYRFSGTNVTWLTRKAKDEGIATLTLDGVNKGNPDLYSLLLLNPWSKSLTGLTNSSHTLVVKVTGTKNTAATGYNIPIDGFRVGTNTVQESSVAVQYNTWIGRATASASGKSYRASATPGATAQIRFTGTSINWITSKGPNYGQATVSIDGVSKGTYDLYKSSAQYKAAIPFKGLAAGTHTLTIRVLGTKNAFSTGTLVAVDAFSGPITVKSPTLDEPSAEGNVETGE